MNIPRLPAPIYISRPAALERLVETLRGETLVAVDTESNSLHAYREQVCLIQFSTHTQDYLVDPLALEDLQPLGAIFASPKIEKVFHAAEYDLICLKRDYQFEFANLFDSMLAVRILGREEIGLGAILEREFDIFVDKRFQRANWGERPLSRQMLSYAQLDTHFLIPLRTRLRQELQQRELWALAQEDFQRLCLVNGRSSEERSDDPWRVHGSYDLSPQQAAVLAELCRYRDQAARKLNRPLFKTISDATLLEIAEQAPGALEELAEITGMTSSQLQRHGEALLQAVQRGLQAPPLRSQRPPRPDDQFLERLDKLRTWRKETAQKMGVNSDVVLPRDLMHNLASRNAAGMEALQELMRGVPWRLEKFGEQILHILENP